MVAMLMVSHQVWGLYGFCYGGAISKGPNNKYPVLLGCDSGSYLRKPTYPPFLFHGIPVFRYKIPKLPKP